jgi:hypothetical protein
MLKFRTTAGFQSCIKSREHSCRIRGVDAGTETSFGRKLLKPIFLGFFRVAPSPATNPADGSSAANIKNVAVVPMSATHKTIRIKLRIIFAGLYAQAESL